MHSEFWQEKWKKGETNFHRDRAHPDLVDYFTGKSPRKVVVPLCGKTLDMRWLREQGHEVVGIELSPIACEAFFVENGLTFEKRGLAYVGDRISIWCTDFFQSPAQVWENCGTVYDRAALVALPREMRRRYADHLLQNRGRADMLLISLEYASAKEIGPPFSVPEQEIRDLYEGKLVVQPRRSGIATDLSHRPPKFTSIEVLERSYELTPAPEIAPR